MLMKKISFVFLLLLLSFTLGALAQQQIQGQVFDETGETVIGASVAVKGTTTGGITDFNGEFSVPLSELILLHLRCIWQGMPMQRDVLTVNFNIMKECL